MDLVRLFEEKRGDIPPLSSSKSKAFECLIVSLVNHFQYYEATNSRLIRDFLSDTWTPRIWQALVNSPNCDQEKQISWENWLALLTHIITKRVYQNNRPRRIDLEDESQCKIEGCLVKPEEWDHIWPHSFGGPNEEWNYMHLCKLHNRMKSSSLQMFSYLLLEDENYYSSFYDWIIGQDWYVNF